MKNAAAQQREPQRGLTFEDVWAAMMETDRKFQETDRKMQETDRKFQETDRKMQETDRKFQETDRKMQETNREIRERNREMQKTYKMVGELCNRFGELAEHLVTPNIAEKFRELNYAFTKAGPNVEFFDSDGKALTEVDVWLENGDFVMAVEVKSYLSKSDVKYHLKRMDILRRYLDERHDTRKLLGAAAGAIFKNAAKEYALESGFYVIEQSGDTVQIKPPEGFKPRIW